MILSNLKVDRFMLRRRWSTSLNLGLLAIRFICINRNYTSLPSNERNFCLCKNKVLLVFSEASTESVSVSLLCDPVHISYLPSQKDSLKQTYKQTSDYYDVTVPLKNTQKKSGLAYFKWPCKMAEICDFHFDGFHVASNC